MAQTGLAAAFVVPIASTARGEPMMSYETYVRFCPDCGYTEESGDQDFLFMVRECPACALLGPIMYQPPISASSRAAHTIVRRGLSGIQQPPR
jgi:hypothetical protein